MWYQNLLVGHQSPPPNPKGSVLHLHPNMLHLSKDSHQVRSLNFLAVLTLVYLRKSQPVNDHPMKVLRFQDSIHKYPLNQDQRLSSNSFIRSRHLQFKWLLSLQSNQRSPSSWLLQLQSNQRSPRTWLMPLQSNQRSPRTWLLPHQSKQRSPSIWLLIKRKLRPH